MHGTSGTTAKLAKSDTTSSCGQRRRALRLNATVMQKSRDLFPIKTAQHLADATGYSIRACETWLSGKTVLPADALVALMHAENGREFLLTVMLGNSWRWWLQLKAGLTAVDIAAVQMKQRRKLRELLNDEAAMAPQGSTALRIHDEAFMEGQPSPYRQPATRKAR